MLELGKCEVAVLTTGFYFFLGSVQFTRMAVVGACGEGMRGLSMMMSS